MLAALQQLLQENVKLLKYYILKRHSPSLVCIVISIPLMRKYENNKCLTPQMKSIWQTFPCLSLSDSALLGLAGTRL